MAGVITHMIIAREMNKLLPVGTIKDMGLFYLGNLAPDAIHARKGYIRPYKMHTHFRDDIPDQDFALEKNLAIFYQRTGEFIEKHVNRKDELVDLYRGYVVHVLADELFIRTLRKEFCETLEAQGILQSNPLFFEYIVADMTRNDYLLLQEYEGCEEIKKSLEQTKVVPVAGYLTLEEMRISRDWLLRQHFYETPNVLPPRYIHHEKLLNFIRMAAEDITLRLSDNVSFPKLFG